LKLPSSALAEEPTRGEIYVATGFPAEPFALDAPTKNEALPVLKVPVAPDAVLPLSKNAISNPTLPRDATPLTPVKLGETCETTVPAFAEAVVTVRTPAPPQDASPHEPLPHSEVPEIVPV
jgi:hypothetical protein